MVINITELIPPSPHNLSETFRYKEDHPVNLRIGLFVFLVLGFVILLSKRLVRDLGLVFAIPLLSFALAPTLAFGVPAPIVF